MNLRQPTAPVAPPGRAGVTTALSHAAQAVAFGRLPITAGVHRSFSQAKQAPADAE